MADIELCTARRTDGQPCKNRPIRGGKVCHFHGGAAPQVKNAARQRLLAAVDGAAAVLVQMVNDRDLPPAVRLQAVRDLLDRAGLGAKQQVEVEVKRYEQLIDAGELVIDVEDEHDAEILELGTGRSA